MKRITLMSLVFLLINTKLKAQNSEYKLQNYHPASPSAFQFQKYDEIPVSEYTGIPSISIPLYQIEEDGVTMPLSLNYHAGGIRVNEEASWVGLGWDFNSGSIIQEINDRDDYGIGVVRLQPDWNESPIPANYPRKYSIMGYGTLANGWGDIDPVYPSKSLYSYRIYSSYLISVSTEGTCFMSGFTGAHSYYIPINGNRDNQPVTTDIVENPYYDSEPDIFTANFPGHSLKFILNPKANNIIVLNKTGYKVQRTGNVYVITVPSGEEYYFEVLNEINSYSETVGGIGIGSGVSITETMPSSKIWMLTKVITKNKRQIILNYTTNGTVNNYPVYSEKWDKVISSASNTINGTGATPEGYTDFPVEGVGKTYSYSSEKKFYLSSISFPNGQMNFSVSDRNDMIGGKKLDAVSITAAGKVIKSYLFNYSYFDASNVGGNKYQPNNAASFGNAPNFRLKLLSMLDNSGATHEFTYSAILLPSKNSLSQDFWGFYNGQLLNSSLIPNPARFNPSQLCTTASLGDNGNNNSANLTFAQAGILTAIKYPTGGKVSLEYELNTFDNYLVPDFSTTTNQLSSGNGLRIKAVSFHENDNVLSKKTVYAYYGGKALIPLQICRAFSINSLQLGQSSGAGSSITTYSIIEINARGFYSSNALGSGSGIGYDLVIKKDIDGSGADIGRTETYFNNNPDLISSNANSSSQLSIAMPSKKKISSTYGGGNSDFPENGTVKSVLIYNKQNRLLRKIENTYGTLVSPLYYGARMFTYASEYFMGTSINCATFIWYPMPRTLTGYYPIFDIESLLLSTVTTEYDENNTGIEMKELYSYGSFNLLRSKVVVPSTGTDDNLYENYERAYEYFIRTGNSLLYNSNRLTEITNVKTGTYHVYKKTGPHFFPISEISKDYSVFGNRIAISTVKIKGQDDPNPKIVTYDQYDDYGNPLQYTGEGGNVSSLLWDYNSEYVITEVQNANNASVAHTSFESDGKGNWIFTGAPAPDNTALTGKKVYDPSLGALTKTISTAGTYIVSYWSKNGARNVNGTIATVGRSINGWTYYEHKVTLAVNGTVTVSGAGVIDELRLYPEKALMTTYTYEPLIGMTSQCDANNRISFYEYDPFNRLKLIRDQDGKIVKTFDYKYQQPQ